MCNVIIIGAGGHAKVIADIVIKSGDKLLGFLDDCKTGKVIGDYEVIGKTTDVLNFSDDTEFIIGIGNNRVRKDISEKYNLKWYTAVHPSSQIGLDSTVGEGSCVMANSVISPNCKIGCHCIINTAAVVEHDSVIGDYVHISPNATLCGTVSVGNLCHIGAATVVRNNISIADDVIIGAGGAVVKDINKSGVYAGVPVKLLKN